MKRRIRLFQFQYYLFLDAPEEGGGGGNGGGKNKGANNGSSAQSSSATVYIETDGLGHVYISVNGVVFSYGRYNGSYSPASGAFGPYGDGVLLKLEGQDATKFIRERMEAYPTNSFKINDLNIKSTFDYLNNLYLNGKPVNNINVQNGKIINMYSLIGPGGDNCTTIISRALEKGGVNIGIFQTPASMNSFFFNTNAIKNGYNPGLWGPKR